MEESLEQLQYAYARCGEPELMTLARAYDSLSDAAQSALRAEFARRGLEPPLIEDEAGHAQGALVTVDRFRDLSEALVARALLEASGIAAVLQDENLIRLDWGLSNFIGGMRLQVHPDDVLAARELLANQIPEPIPYSPAARAYTQPTCPVCGSAEIAFEGNKRGPALVALYLLGLPLPHGAPTWHCHHCDTRWQDDGRDASRETS